MNGEVDYAGDERPREHVTRVAEAWSRLEPMVPLLFKEPNPVPIKHCLSRRGLIAAEGEPSEYQGEAYGSDTERIATRLVPAGVAG